MSSASWVQIASWPGAMAASCGLSAVATDIGTPRVVDGTALEIGEGVHPSRKLCHARLRVRPSSLGGGVDVGKHWHPEPIKNVQMTLTRIVLLVMAVMVVLIAARVFLSSRGR